MAKSFNQVIKRANAKMYSNTAMALVLMARMNTAVDFQPVLAPNGGTDLTKTSSYMVQRELRPTGVKTVANANAGTTASALAVLDSFETTEWVSLPVATGVLKSLGFKGVFGDDFNMESLSSVHVNEVKKRVSEIAIDRKKTLFDKIMAGAHASKASYTITKQDRSTTETIVVPELAKFVEGKTAVWTSLASALLTFNRIDDQFATESDSEDTLVIVSPEIALNLTKEMGTVFNQEAAIAQTGFKTGMAINGTPVIVDNRLAAGEVLIINKLSVAFKKDKISKNIDQSLAHVDYKGEVFYDIIEAIGKERMWKLTTSTTR